MAFRNTNTRWAFCSVSTFCYFTLRKSRCKIQWTGIVMGVARQVCVQVVFKGSQMAERLGSRVISQKVVGSIPGRAKLHCVIGQGTSPYLPRGECPCSYYKSLWMRASAKWLNVNVCMYMNCGEHRSKQDIGWNTMGKTPESQCAPWRCIHIPWQWALFRREHLGNIYSPATVGLVDVLLWTCVSVCACVCVCVCV